MCMHAANTHLRVQEHGVAVQDVVQHAVARHHGVQAAARRGGGAGERGVADGVGRLQRSKDGKNNRTDVNHAERMWLIGSGQLGSEQHMPLTCLQTYLQSWVTCATSADTALRP